MDVILFLVFWFVCAFLHYVLWMSYFGGKYPQFRHRLPGAILGVVAGPAALAGGLIFVFAFVGGLKYPLRL